jgi:NAD(P)-dependent dehydrogenase (short-subunit alcohol dehydrogenase family)
LATTASTPGPVALITGASKGIGRESARRLGALGMTVFIGARDPVRGRQSAAELAADGSDIRFLLLDVTDVQSIKSASVRIEEEFHRLDVLVNNAAVMIDGASAVTEVTVEQVRQTYETNVFGVVAVMHALLPLLKRSPAPRIVNLSSGLGSLTANVEEFERLAPYQRLAYSSSKAALNAVTVLYANALRDHGFKVNAADPGYVATDINGHRGYRTVEQGAEIVVRMATLGADGPTATFQADSGTVPW